MKTVLRRSLLFPVVAASLAACSSNVTDDSSRPATHEEALVTSPWSWTGWESLGGSTSSSPTLASDGTSLYAFIVDDSANILVNSAPIGTPNGWRGWRALGDQSGGPVSVARQGGTLGVFFRHLGDRHLHGIFGKYSSWSAPTDIGGVLGGNPVAITIQDVWNGPTIHVFASGPDDLLRVNASSWLAPQIASQWTDWQYVGSQPSSITGFGPIDVVSVDGRREDIVTEGNYDLIHVSRSDTTQPFTWEHVTNGHMVTVSAASIGAGHLDIVWQDASGNTFSQADVNGVWQPSTPLGGEAFHHRFESRPKIAAVSGVLQYVTQGWSYGLYAEGAPESTAMNAWRPIGSGCGEYAVEPSLLQTTSTTLDLLAVGSDHVVYHAWYNGPGVTGPTNLPACSCGGDGQSCCGNGENGTGCNGSSSTEICSQFNQCEACGRPGQACCLGASPCSVGNCVNTMDGPLCQSCGAQGQSCCLVGEGCGTGLTCGSAGTCIAQGWLGEPCLPGGYCQGDLSCVSNTCQSSATCGEAGQACCLGSTPCMSGNGSCVNGTCQLPPPQPPPPPPPMVCFPYDKTICAAGGVPPNYIVTDEQCDSTCSDSCFQSNSIHVVEYVNEPAGAQIQICADQAVPGGWSTVKTVSTPGHCMASGQSSILIQRNTSPSSCAMP